MDKCSKLLSPGDHLYFCKCPEMQPTWHELDKNFRESFKNVQRPYFKPTSQQSENKENG